MFKRSKPNQTQQPTPAIPDKKPSGVGLRIYTSNFLITGRTRPEGPLGGWLNIPNKRVMIVKDAQVSALAPNSPLNPAAFPQITVPKEQIIAIEVLDGVGTMRVEPRQLPAVFYTERFVIRAELRLPAQAPPEQYFNLLGGSFFTVTNPQLHPVLATRPNSAEPGKVLLLNRDKIDFYHLL